MFLKKFLLSLAFLIELNSKFANANLCNIYLKLKKIILYLITIEKLFNINFKKFKLVFQL